MSAKYRFRSVRPSTCLYALSTTTPNRFGGAGNASSSFFIIRSKHARMVDAANSNRPTMKMLAPDGGPPTD
jgi:hypothetical protein